MYLLFPVLGLRCRAQAFSSCSEWASRCGDFSHRRAQALGSVNAALGLSCPAVCVVFPNQGSNLCPLHWQMDSSPLDNQGSLPWF